MKGRNKEIKKLMFSIIGVSIFLIVMTTYVYLPKQENLMSSLAFLQNQKRFYMQDISSGILLKDATPVKDEVGLEYEPYQFKVVNHSNLDITYRIVFKNDIQKAKAQEKEILPNRYLRYTLTEGYNIDLEPATLQEDGILYTTTISAHSETTFEFRMWLDYNADNDAMNKVFIGKIEIEEVR